jgi:hypothetical protein
VTHLDVSDSPLTSGRRHYLKGPLREAVTFSGRLHAQPSIQTMTSAKTIVGPILPFWHNLSAITTIPLALLTKRRRGQNFSVEDIELKVFGRSGSTARRSTCRNFLSGDSGKPALTGAFDVQSRNASKLDQKSVSARIRPPDRQNASPRPRNPPRSVVRVRPARLSPDHTACYAYANRRSR